MSVQGTRNAKVFSSTYMDRWWNEVILQVGSTRFTRQQMIDDLHVGHFNAARTVTHVLRNMDITSVAGIRRIPMFDWARVEGVGEAALRILIELLIHDRYTTSEIEDWLTKELRGEKLVQWSAICHQATTRARKRGKHAA